MSTILIGDALTVLRTMPDESVQCVVTSPPYWGLRNYGVEGQLGLEATPELYVEHMVEVFREVRRVLRGDGTAWVNLGSCYSSGGPSLSEALGGLLERALVVFVDGLPVTPSSEGVNVSPLDEGLPESKLSRFLTSQGDGPEYGDEHLGQVLHLLAHPGNGRAGSSSGGMKVDAAHSKMPLYEIEHGFVVQADGNPEPEAELVVLRPSSTGPSENDERSLSVGEPHKPSREHVVVWHSDWHSFAANAFSERLPDVNVMDQPVPLRDGLGAFACPLGDFAVTQAGEKQLSLTSITLGLRLSIASVGHCRFLLSDGSIVPYATLLVQAQRRVNALGAKQDLMMPERVAIALREDGWILRSSIIWHKPNPMPESVTDRPTKSHEYIFLLSKSARYFYDAEAIREPDSGQDHPRNVIDGEPSLEPSGGLRSAHGGIRTEVGRNGHGRNARTVWTIATQPYSGAHFATFPEELARRCIAAGTSTRGCCPECGAPWRRETARSELKGPGHENYKLAKAQTAKGTNIKSRHEGWWPNHGYEYTTLGFRPTCDHGGEPIPCTVLDPFGGAGTVGVVAQKLGREYVLIELKPEYAEMARARVHDEAPLFAADAISAEATP